MLIALDFIADILEVIFWTAGLREGIPLSCFLIARSGAGKSRSIVPFVGTNLFRCDDLTSSGLQQTLEADKDNVITHILISDFNAVLSHKTSTTNLTIGNLLALMSEGTMRIADGRRNKELKHNPVGLVVGITPEMYEMNFSRWNNIGFCRRFLPIFYDYSALTIVKIMEAIEKNKVRMVVGPPKEFQLPLKKQQPIWSAEVSRMLDSLTYQFCDNLAVRPTFRRSSDQQIQIVPLNAAPPLPFTPKQMLQELAEGHALKRKSPKVQDVDLAFVGKIISFTRYGYPVQL